MPSSQTNPSETLATLTSGPEYLGHVSRLLQDLQSAEDRFRAVELLRDATQRMGAEVSMLASISQGGAIGRCHRLLLACDPRWGIEYERLDWSANDPWLAYARRNTEPIKGEDIAITSERQRAIVQLAHRFGFVSSVIVPIATGGEDLHRGLLCLGSSAQGFFGGEGYAALKIVARGIGAELYRWWLACLKRQIISEAGITELDVRLLALEAQGLSSKEIARRIDSTISSIDSRFQRINVRLGVSNRQASARVAAELGLVEASVFVHNTMNRHAEFG